MIRRSLQRDANEPAIVKALRAIGASVHPLHVPCDLLVGYQGRTYLMEVKSPLGPKGGASRNGQKLNEKQQAFADAWAGQFAIVRTIQEALDAIGVQYVDTRGVG